MKRVHDDTDAAFRYVNLEAVNNTGTVQKFEATTIVGKLLKQPKDYFVAVARLVFSGASIPLLIIPEDKYKVSVYYNNVFYTQSLVYVPDDKRYGANTVYSYISLAETITTALQTAHDAAVVGGMPVGDKPFFSYSEGTKIFTLATPQDYKTNGATIRFNVALYGLFNNFYHAVYPQDTDAEVWIKPNPSDPTTASPLSTNPSGVNPLVATGYDYCLQEYEALFNIQEYTTIIIRSSRLGISPELLPGVNNTSKLTADTTSGVPSSTNMITDLIAYIGGDFAGVRGTQYYAPSLYRWIALQNEKLEEIDLQVYIRDKIGNELPYFIPPYTTAKIKLVFGHKDYIY